MIDSQLYVLYKRFKRAEGVDFEKANTNAIEKFISKMVYDSFSAMMREQVGFSIDFKKCCDAVVRYMMYKNGVETMEEYGKVMLELFNTVSALDVENIRVDTQLEFDRKLNFSDVFCQNIAETIIKMLNLNYRWHLFFLVLFNLQSGEKTEILRSYIGYYKGVFESSESFALLSGYDCADDITEDLLDAYSEIFRERKNIEYLCGKGVDKVHEAIGTIVPKIAEELSYGTLWEDIRDDCVEDFMAMTVI